MGETGTTWNRQAAEAFLRRHLPAEDRELDPAIWEENLEFASRVRTATPCGMVVPEDVFLNDVLPHCFLDERRSAWRRRLYERFVERAHRAASVEDAVFLLNRAVFDELDVRYHPTRRPRNNMGVQESIDCGYASCTGLSILLAAACRAVGIPARLAGVEAWSDGSGNHTWLEVWDHGRWRVVPAAEGFAFDQTWFNDKARHETVYAVSYRETGTRFPLAWESDATVHGVDVSARYRELPPTPEHPTSISVRPRRTLCPRIDADIEITGRLDDPAWERAPWTEPFVDIEDNRKPTPRYTTRAKMLWNDRWLYVGARLEDPQVWGTLTERNRIIFNDPDFEIFIDPDGDNHNYWEFEVNALGTTWELTLERPYRDGGPVHRGDNMPGLVSRVHVDGTINDPSVQDRGWSVEVAIPWEGLRRYAGEMACPPREGDTWRINFSRVHWLFDVVDGRIRKVPREAHPEDNWVWSPQHAIDMHRPEWWGFVQFGGEALRPDPSWPVRELLMRVYDLQRERPAPTGNVAELGIRGRWEERIRDLSIVLGEKGKWHANARWVDEKEGLEEFWRVDSDSRLTRI